MKTLALKTLPLCFALSAASTAALADHERYSQGNYNYGTSGANYGDYADVISATPAFRYEQVSVPRQHCQNVPDYYHGHDGGHLSSTTGQTVIGGLLGAALGNQIGDGRGRDIATVAGGLIGASIGANRANRQQQQYGPSYRQKCSTQYSSHQQQVADGYDVTYRYAGRTYHTRLPYHPGSRMRVNVDVAPEYTSHSRQAGQYY